MYIYTTTQQKQKFFIYCKSESTRYGFRHLATISDEYGYTLSVGKACYYNRTWEYYTFQTVIYNALSKLELSPDKHENEKRIKALKRQIDKKGLDGKYQYVNL